MGSNGHSTSIFPVKQAPTRKEPPTKQDVLDKFADLVSTLEAYLDARIDDQDERKLVGRCPGNRGNSKWRPSGPVWYNGGGQ